MTARNPLDTLLRRRGRFEFPVGSTDGKWFTLSDLFEQLPPVGAAAAGGNPNFSATGTGTVPTLTFASASSAGLQGVVLATRTTSAADNDQARLTPFATSAWGKAHRPTSGNVLGLEGVITTPSAITDIAIGFGWKLTDTGVLGTDDNQAYILFDTDATTPAGSTTQWVAVSSSGGTDTVTASGVTVAASTTYKLRVEVGTDLKGRFYINDQLVHTSATALPNTADLIPSVFVISRANAGAAKSITVRKVRRFLFTA